MLFRLSPLPLALASVLAMVARPARAAPPAAEAAAAIDISPVKDRLEVLHDGKKHYVVLIPFGDISEHVYWGDGKTFHQQRVFGGGSSGNGKGPEDSFDRVFWEPRTRRGQGSLGLHQGKYTVECDERKTELALLPEAEARAMLDAARFLPARWKHRAYALARDNTGKYYYVDRAREPADSKVFRLWAGPKGSLKPQKMINVVSDSEGDIFATRSGQLRLILDKKETTWIQGKKQVPLTSLAVDDNHVLIYSDLGVYTGQPLGTPCDDL